MKVALCYIVKDADDEAVHLQRSLASVANHVDAVFININGKKGDRPSTKLREITKQYNVIETEWHDNFAEARNANFAQVPEEYDWILWLDADDTIDKPKKIREVCQESERYDSIYVDYLYDRDEEGNPLTVHMVARLVKNNSSHKWKGSIHETLVEQRSATQGMTKDFMVVHHADAERTGKSYERNITMLEKQIESEQKDPDPRTFYYLGSTYIDAGHLDAAISLLSDYLTMSGWDQERCVAETKLGRVYMQKGDKAEAKKHFMLAIGEDPDNPEPRVEMGSLELEVSQYRKAQVWLEGVLKMEKQSTTLEVNPMTYTFRTYLLLADTYMGMGGKWLEKAAKYAKKARAYKKSDPKIMEYTEIIEKVYADKLELEAIVKRYKGFLDKGQKRKAQKALDSIPERLADNPVVARLRQRGKPFKWPKKSIVIMTGETALDAWGPWSLAEGIGGSEEAIIRLAPKLAKLGYKVVVFGKPGARPGLYDGVMWRNFWEWNPEDTFDIFVAWRAPFLFEKKIKARKNYLWLHDVMEAGEFGENRLKNINKVIVLSKYHRSLFPMIPEDKVLLSANGIDPEEFEMPYKNPATEQEYDANKKYLTNQRFNRNPHKILYASSHVRGLAYLYKIWPDVKKAVPDATLDVYYGRESYDKVHKGNPERMKWMDDMIAKAKELDGVTDHGKVSQTEITKEGFRSGLWAYPCVTGDTLVDMPRNYQEYPLGVPIRKLVGKKNFPVWSYNETTGAFELKNVNWVAKTRTKAKIIKINWTDGTSLRCTPDHKVYTYKRGWVAAKDLEVGESAVALKKHMMIQVSAGQGKWPYEHRMIAEYTLGKIPKGYHVDHEDGNCFNNEPSNLQILSPSDHARKTYKEQYSTKPLIERRKAALAKYRATEKGKKQLSEIGRKRSQSFWDGMTPKERVDFITRRNEKRKVGSEKWWSELPEEKKATWGESGRKARYNHKVESIEDVGFEDVYDMNVDENHNFIAGGVVVHNCPFPEIYCITAIKSQASGAVPVASNFAALDETIQFGHKQDFKEFDDDDLEKYKQALIWWLQHPEEQEKVRPAMQVWARTQSWQHVAETWNRSFNE